MIDTDTLVRHFGNVKSLLEIEEAIAKLPAKARRQLVKDIPALCPNEFPPDGWDAIFRDETPRPAWSSFLDKLDAGHYCRKCRPVRRSGSARFKYLVRRHR